MGEYIAPSIYQNKGFANIFGIDLIQTKQSILEFELAYESE